MMEEKKEKGGVCMACACPCAEHTEHTHDQKPDKMINKENCPTCGVDKTDTSKSCGC